MSDTRERASGGGGALRLTALLVAAGVALELVTLVLVRPSGFLAFIVVGAITLVAGVIGFTRLRRR